MKSSKADVEARIHKIPRLRFTGQRKLTSYAGIVIFQALFARLGLLSKLRACVRHLVYRGTYGTGKILLLLIIHLLLGFRRLRGLDYYRADPLVARVAHLKSLPDVATISRALAECDDGVVENLRDLNRTLVLDRIAAEKLSRVTLDFDGSVQSTKGHAEGTAVGFNKKKKGARSYYPLFATVAQLDEFFDVLHRPGNVHDSNGAFVFMADCIARVREGLGSQLRTMEARVDSAFYIDEILGLFDEENVDFTCSVPFERLHKLKGIVEERKTWDRINEKWSFFEVDWKPNRWDDRHRLVCLRSRRKIPIKGPLQLDLFEPRDYEFEYKVVATNKTESAKSVLLFHNGRGSQEKIFGEAKQNAALDYLPSRRCIGNQIYTLCGMVAHNLSRELQMWACEPQRTTTAKRRSLWTFESLSTLRQHLLHKAGVLARPQGELTLTMNAEDSVRDELTRYLEALQPTH